MTVRARTVLFTQHPLLRMALLSSSGILSSAVTVLMMVRMMSMFGMGMPFSLELYLGLGIFMAYVVFDTQVRTPSPYDRSACYLYLPFYTPSCLQRWLIVPFLCTGDCGEGKPRRCRPRGARTGPVSGLHRHLHSAGHHPGKSATTSTPHPNCASCAVHV